MSLLELRSHPLVQCFAMLRDACKAPRLANAQIGRPHRWFGLLRRACCCIAYQAPNGHSSRASTNILTAPLSSCRRPSIKLWSPQIGMPAVDTSGLWRTGQAIRTAISTIDYQRPRCGDKFGPLNRRWRPGRTVAPACSSEHPGAVSFTAH